MDLCVVGAGPVGVATAVTYARAGHRVVLVERDGARRSLMDGGRLPFLEPGLEEAWRAWVGGVRVVPRLCDAGRPALVACCVGTPSASDGSADLSQVASVVQALMDLPPTVFMMRSTVPPGTGDRIAQRLAAVGHAYVAHPEFLREGTAFEDSIEPSRLVVGASTASLHEMVIGLCPDMECPKLGVSIATAEMIKLAANVHLAMRVSFINEIAAVAAEVGADVDDVSRGIGLDPRIGDGFLRSGLGFGGPCLPKDARAFLALGRELGIDLPLVSAVHDVNLSQPAAAVRLLRRRVGDLCGRRVGIWGFAFKPGTDDTRESPAVRLVERLREARCHVAVHDPKAMWPTTAVPDVSAAEDALEACRDAEILVLATEWPEYRAVDPVAVARFMKPPRLVLDTRLALDRSRWRAAGLDLCAWGVGGPCREPVLDAAPKAVWGAP